jgi:iron complex outermembrane receptor protein
MNLEFLLSNRTELQSYFGRVNATLFNKLINYTLRSDGSTKLGENNKYDYFPSVGIAYKVENKDGIVNDFKIRETLVKQVTKFSLTQLKEVLMD